MTLATVVLFFGIFCNAAPSRFEAVLMPPCGPPTSTSFSEQQDQGGTSTQSGAPTTKSSSTGSNAAQVPTVQTQNPHKTSHRKKKPSSGCVDSSKPGEAAASPSNGDTVSTATNPGGQISAASKSGGNCPPPKIVVRQGGSVEPAIQLAGGTAGGQASQEKATANQMVEATEENLKKIAGRQLSASEQEMITQIRQYIDQSKTAASAGDPERARNFAWKAQTLSEDLVKPEK
jgi:hypothetical protein